jgi:hypothetical protein
VRLEQVKALMPSNFQRLKMLPLSPVTMFALNCLGQLKFKGTGMPSGLALMSWLQRIVIAMLFLMGPTLRESIGQKQ